MKSSVAVTASESGAPEQTHQAPVSATTSWSWRNLVGNTEFQLLVALLVLIGVWAFLYPEVFPTSDNFLNMGRVGSILLVVAIGQMFALVVGGFDLSVAANMGFVSTVVAMHITGGTAFVDGVLLGLAVGAAIGLVNGILIAGLGITPFVATLGTLTFLTGYGNQLSQGQSIASLPSGFQALGGGDWGPLPAAIGIAAITLLVAWIVLARTRVGLYVFAIGGSRETARVSGIAVKRYEILAYTACGFFAGLAGIMLASRVSVGVTSLGQGYDLLSIATAVIGGVAIGGGIGKLRGVVLGVVLLTVLRNGLDIGGLNEFAQQMITGVVLIVAVLAARTRGIDIAGIFRRGRRGAAGDGSLPAG